MQEQRDAAQARVVVIGAGFGGLWATTALGNSPAEVVLIDRNNYHTFMPLLYQVAAAEIGADQTVTPIRKVLRQYPNVRFVLGEVSGIDLERRAVQYNGSEMGYDYLVLAAGAVSHFFDIPGAAEHALPLRTLEQASDIRNHILSRWEDAAREPDPERRKALLTFTIVGAGPTGIEFAGALAELLRIPLERDFPEIQLWQPRIVLLEALDQALMGMPPRLGEYAIERLRAKGVEVRLNSMVSEVTEESVALKDGSRIRTRTVVWTAGVTGHPLARHAGMPATKQGQVPVFPTLQVPGHREVHVIGDLASVVPPGRPTVPLLATAAMQQGEHAAGNIQRQMKGLEPLPFFYKDRGMLAVIGRNAAVARVWHWSFTGFPAWVLWLGVHLVQLIGFRNRLLVLINWTWNYLFFERGVRVILPYRRTRAPRREQVHVASAPEASAQEERAA